VLAIGKPEDVKIHPDVVRSFLGDFTNA